MLSEHIISELRSIVGKNNVTTEKADRICYSYDATQKSFLPDVVVHPAPGHLVERLLHHLERVPVAGAGPFRLRAELLYQPIGFRWAHNLGGLEAIEARRFTRYYEEMASSATTLLAAADAVVR